MVIGDIPLSSGIRNSLYSLETNALLLQRTQQRLSTGKAVNTPLDNATNFFAASNHLSRANDLNSRKDTITEGIQTLKATENGINAISAILDSMRAIANQAVTASDQNERNAYARTYVDLRSQINLLVSDSGYRGTNLLNSENLTLEFSERTGVSKLEISGFDSSADGLGVGNKITSGTGGIVPVQAALFNTYHHLPGAQFTDNFNLGGVTQTTVDATLQVSFSNSAPTGFIAGMSVDTAVMNNGTLSVTGTVGQDVPASVVAANPSPPPPTINVPTYANITWGGNIERTFATWSNSENVLEVYVDGILQENNYALDNKGNIVFNISSEPVDGQIVTFIRGDTWDTTESAMISLRQIDGALETLRSKSKSLSSTLSIATTRLDFNAEMINILTTGADNLTLADMNQESANLLVLQAQQNLGISSLSMASRFQQGVLRLFL